MSADDFQVQYTSAMERMLGTAVAQTTKLFESMVDELKAEISRMRRENEDLKTRCGRLEKALCGPAVSVGGSGGSGTCERAVQCGEPSSQPLSVEEAADSRSGACLLTHLSTVPFHSVFVEQCQPQWDVSLQDPEQQCSYQTESSLQDHSYETNVRGNSQMVFTVVKQESVFKQDEPGMVYRRVFSADTAGSFIDHVYSSGEIPLFQRHGETQVALELQSLEVDSSLQGAQNQSAQLEHPLVLSFASRIEDLEEESNVGLKISEIGSQGELITPGQHPVQVAPPQSEVVPLEKQQPTVLLQECQRESETSLSNVFLSRATQFNTGKTCDEVKTGMADGEVSSQPCLAAQHGRGQPAVSKGEACDESKNGVAGSDASSQSDLQVKRRRGRPPKKVKCSGQPIEHIFKSPSTDLPIQAASAEVSTDIESLETPAQSAQELLIHPRECRTSVPLRDAMLLVDAMNQSVVVNAFTSPLRMEAQQQTPSCVGTTQTVEEIPAGQHTPLLPVGAHEGSLTEVVTATQSTTEKPSPAPQAINDIGIPSATISSMPSSNTAIKVKSTPLHSNITVLIPRRVSANTSDNLESHKQSASVSETINAPLLSSLNTSARLVPDSLSPIYGQQCSAVVRLTQLPFPVSTKETVLISTLFTNGSSETLSVLKERFSEEKPSPVVMATQSSEMDVFSTEICPILKEASVAVSVRTGQVSQEPADIQEKTLSSGNCTIWGKSPDSGYMQQPTPSKVSVQTHTTDLSGESDSAIVPTLHMEEEMLISSQKQSAGLIHQTSTTSKDTLEPHLRRTQTQFLAQLVVSPVLQNPEKASSNNSRDAGASCPETSCKKRSQKNCLITQLQSHQKFHSQDITETNAEQCTTCTVNPEKPGLENDSPRDRNTTSEPVPVDTKKPGSDENVSSVEITTMNFVPISPVRSGLYKDGVKSKRTVNESTSVGSWRSHAESRPVTPSRSSSGQNGDHSKNKKSPSVHPRRCSSTKQCASPIKTTDISKRPRRSSCSRSTSTKKKNTSVSPGTSNLTKESANSKKTKNPSVCCRRPSSTRDGASLKNAKTVCSFNNAKTTSVRPKRTSSSRGEVCPPKTKSTSGTATLSKNGTSAIIPTSAKDSSATEQIKRELISVCLRSSSIAADGTMSETGFPNVRRTKLTQDCVSPGSTIKKPRLIQDGTDPNKNLNVFNAKKLSKAALIKIKTSNQSQLHNGAKTSHLAANSSSSENLKKCTAKAVWTPPKMPASQTREERLSLLPVKKVTRSQNHNVVYPPSVSLHPIPVTAPPIVSPLQPLSVIGKHLLKNQCGECGCVLSSRAALEDHVSLHTGRRPFSCKLCGKQFPDSKGLKHHGRAHRNGRIHICQQCGKGFVYRFGLTKHIQMVHDRIKPFVCHICNKRFFTKQDEEAHTRIHTGEKPFHCNLCDKKFTRRVELNVHLRWHNGEKRHWCPYCGKGFLDSNNLKRHKYIHTGEKPHSCPHCPKHFTQSSHLKKHVKNVHKIQ